MRVIEGLRKTVVPCPKRYKGRKTIATLVDINCQVIKKQVDRKVKVFLLLLSNKQRPSPTKPEWATWACDNKKH